MSNTLEKNDGATPTTKALVFERQLPSWEESSEGTTKGRLESWTTL